MKKFLFPHFFKPIGWVLFIPSLIVWGLFFLSITTSIDVLPSFAGIAETIVNDIVIISTIIGALFIVCSKERIEDEMTKSIRLSSLLNSIYAYVILLVICTLLINGFSYLEFVVFNLALFPIIFVCNFRLEMHRYNKMCEDEK